MAVFKSSRFVLLPYKLFDLELDPVSFKVYACLCYLMDTSNNELIDDEEIISFCQISKSQYKRSISLLIKKGIMGKDGKSHTLLDYSDWGRPKIEKPKTPGYVYLAQCGLNFKIGKSKNPQKRIIQLSTSSPHPVILICSIATEDMVTKELRLHQRFNAKRIRGEWFSLSAEDVSEIKAMISNEIDAIAPVIRNTGSKE